jgi:hypothetical protein
MIRNPSPPSTVHRRSAAAVSRRVRTFRQPHFAALRVSLCACPGSEARQSRLQHSFHRLERLHNSTMAKLFICALLALVMMVQSFRVQPFTASAKYVSALNKFRGGALHAVTDRPPVVRCVGNETRRCDIKVARLQLIHPHPHLHRTIRQRERPSGVVVLQVRHEGAADCVPDGRLPEPDGDRQPLAGDASGRCRRAGVGRAVHGPPG